MKLTDIEIGKEYAIGQRNSYDYRSGSATIALVVEIGEMKRKRWGAFSYVWDEGRFVRVRMKGGKEKVVLPRQVVEPAEDYLARKKVKDEAKARHEAKAKAFQQKVIDAFDLQDIYDLRTTNPGVRLCNERAIEVTVGLTLDDVFELWSLRNGSDKVKTTIKLRGETAERFLGMV